MILSENDIKAFCEDTTENRVLSLKKFFNRVYNKKPYQYNSFYEKFKTPMIAPFYDTQIRALDDGTRVPSYGLSYAGYDVRISNEFYIPHKTKNSLFIDPYDIESTVEYTKIEQDFFIMPPHSFVLCRTIEWFTIPRMIVAMLKDKSTLARLGLSIQNTIAEPGWAGNLVVEVNNNTDYPIKLYKEMAIGQMIFTLLTSPASSYNSKYQNQKGLVTAKN